MEDCLDASAPTAFMGTSEWTIYCAKNIKQRAFNNVVPTAQVDTAPYPLDQSRCARRL